MVVRWSSLQTEVPKKNCEDCNAMLLKWRFLHQASDLQDNYSRRAWMLALMLCPIPPKSHGLQWFLAAHWQRQEDGGRAGVPSRVTVEICFLLHTRIKWITVHCCLVDCMEYVTDWFLYIRPFAISVWEVQLTGGIRSFSAWACGTKVEIRFMKASSPCCRELYNHNTSGTKEGFFLVRSMMALEITSNDKHSLGESGLLVLSEMSSSNVSRVTSPWLKKQPLFILSLLWCLKTGPLNSSSVYTAAARLERAAHWWSVWQLTTHICHLPYSRKGLWISKASVLQSGSKEAVSPVALSDDMLPNGSKLRVYLNTLQMPYCWCTFALKCIPAKI